MANLKIKITAWFCSTSYTPLQKYFFPHSSRRIQKQTLDRRKGDVLFNINPSFNTIQPNVSPTRWQGNTKGGVIKFPALNFSSSTQSGPESFMLMSLRSSERWEEVLQTTFLALLFVFQHEDLFEASERRRLRTARLWWWRAGVWRYWPWCATRCSVYYRFWSRLVGWLWSSVFACTSWGTSDPWQGSQKLPIHSWLPGHLITGVTHCHQSIRGPFKFLKDYSLFCAQSLSCRLPLQKSPNRGCGLPLGPQTHVMIAQLSPLETEGADHRHRQGRRNALMPLHEKARLLRANVFVK